MMRLSKTAALVMHWARPLYEEGRPGEYVGAMDLTSADDLLASCERICPWYAEVIRNRKHQIRRWTDDWSTIPGNDQVVILAAGMTPLSLEILERHPCTRIIEIDLDGMLLKKDRFSAIAPDLMDRIEFLEMDIRCPDIMERTSSEVHWFDPHRPTLFIMEGISYYIVPKDLEGIVRCLNSVRGSSLILEYLIPITDIDERVRHIPEGIFGKILEDADHASLSSYSESDVRSLMSRMNGMVSSDVSMSEMERLRKGYVEHFADARSGWIRCANIFFQT